MPVTSRAAAIALLLGGAAFLTDVPTLRANVPEQAPSAVDPIWLRSMERQGARPQEIGVVLMLLNQGKRDEAKRALANILKRYPKDATALEIAGMLLLEEAQYDPAQQAFRRSLASAPGNAHIHAKLGASLLVAGKYDEGEAELKKALQIKPDEPLALRYAGWLEAARGNGVAAAGHYEKLLDIGTMRSAPLNDIHIDLAQVYNGIGRFDRTLDLLAGTAAPQAAPAISARLTNRAQELRMIAHLELGDVDAARKVASTLPPISEQSSIDRILAEIALARIAKDYARAESLIDRIPGSAPALAARKHYERGRLYRDRNDWANATASLERAVDAAADGQRLFMLRELAAALASTGSGARAIQIVNHYAERRPDDLDVRYLGAELAFEAGQMNIARRYASELVEKRPDIARSHYIAGLVAWKDNRHDEAIATLRKAATIDPRDSAVWMALARVQDDHGDFDAMVAALDEGLRALPEHPVLQFELATAHQSRDDDKKANALYRAILKRYPDHIPAMNALGLNLAASKATLEEARKLIMRAYELAPNDPAIRGSYGWLLFKSGQTEKALPLLEEAAKALPENGPALYHLAAAYFALGRVAEAGPLAQKSEDVGGVPGPEHHAAHELIRKTRRANSRPK
ncbi:MAG TPA: tetratricopeptide repeat protein [Alphaproteobacteria bacterium]|nr:tetratricopeptide repeat protein [Alphaproteobacteria bacterium]